MEKPVGLPTESHRSVIVAGAVQRKIDRRRLWKEQRKIQAPLAACVPPWLMLAALAAASAVGAAESEEKLGT